MPTHLLYPTPTCVRMGGYRRLNPHLIIRLRADSNYTLIHEANGQQFLVATTLRVIEERLRPFGFLRVTRGDVINPAFVKKIWNDGTIQLSDGTEICPSRRRRTFLFKVGLKPNEAA
jgi:DNA-binding LytR/AlgR family response regulator